MSQHDPLGEDVLRAFTSLKREDQTNIDIAKAQEVARTVFQKKERVRDGGQAIRYALSQHYVGTQGLQKKRQEVFAAYWRLMRKVLDTQERRMRPIRRKRAEVA